MRKPDESFVGRRFGMLTVCQYLLDSIWQCRCDCGKETKAYANQLKRGGKKSCGCNSHVTHGRSKSRVYNIHKFMLQRCFNRNYNRFGDYGGRGITVCDRWRGHGGFENFLSDLGDPPSDKHKLERKDNDGPYCPENCCWVTQADQSRNRRNNVRISYGGKTLCLKDWASELGIKETTLAYRIKNWPLERAMTERILR